MDDASYKKHGMSPAYPPHRTEVSAPSEVSHKTAMLSLAETVGRPGDNDIRPIKNSSCFGDPVDGSGIEHGSQ